MSRQLEQTLLSLIPTYSSDLPPQLVSVAASLLAQSKLNASVLKPEEEVARLYACAHLACDRYDCAATLTTTQSADDGPDSRSLLTSLRYRPDRPSHPESTTSSTPTSTMPSPIHEGQPAKVARGREHELRPV